MKKSVGPSNSGMAMIAPLVLMIALLGMMAITLNDTQLMLVKHMTAISKAALAQNTAQNELHRQLYNQLAAPFSEEYAFNIVANDEYFRIISVPITPGRSDSVTLQQTVIKTALVKALPDSALTVYDSDHSLLSALFHPHIQNYTGVETAADWVLDDCKDIEKQSGAVIVVKQDCTTEVGQKVGSRSQPAIVIFDGVNVHFNAHTELFGLIVLRASSKVQNTVYVDNSVKIVGAIATTNTAISGHNFANYDQGVLSELLKLERKPLMYLQANSWSRQ